MTGDQDPTPRPGESAAAAALRARLASLPAAKRALFERPDLLRAAPARAEVVTPPPLDAIERLAADQPAPLSFVQEMLWLLHRTAPDMVAYNSPRAYRIRGEFSLAALQAAVNGVVARHEVFRTSIGTAAYGVPVQIVRPAPTVPVVVHDLHHLDEATREAELLTAMRHELHTPFDLERDLLLRVAVWRLAADDHVLLLISHHIASDEWSRGILFREMSALYAAARRGESAVLPPLAIQYRDYAAWQRRRFGSPTSSELTEFWRRTLRDAPLLELPTDRERAPGGSFEGSRVAADLPAALLADLKRVAETQGVSLFMLLLAAFEVLLHRYTGQDDIVVGSPFAGRERPETHGLIGFFSNTVVLRAQLRGDPTFTEFLQGVRRVCLDAYEHAELPFEKMLNELQRDRELEPLSGRTPLVRALFTLTEERSSPLVLDGARSVETFGAAGHWTKTDVSLALRQRSDGSQETLRSVLEFSTELFDAGTAQRLLEHYATLLGSIVRDPSLRVSALALLPDPERDRLLEWGRGPIRNHAPATITELIDAQAAATPTAIAVEFGDATLTYARLAERTERLAAALRQAGCGRGTAVGVCLERSPELIVALLGIVKAGAYYVPLDPQYPADRLAYILSDSDARALLHRAPLPAAVAEVVQAGRVARISVDELPGAPSDGAHGPPADAAGPSPDDLAYVIYTSGSTGKPKGVMVRHRSVATYLRWMQGAYPLTPADRVLQKAPVSFDASVWELFLPLVTGARLVLARSDRQQDPEYLLDLIERAGVTTVQFVPSQLQMLLAGRLERAFAGVRHLVCGGEALGAELLQAVRRRVRPRITNLYGPTEATVYATHWSLAPEEEWDGERVPIGRPIDDARIAVIDGSGELTPIGVPGELVIAGAGVAAGYWSRPELTAERFVADITGNASDRMYRTNDRARWRADGTLEFLGRMDDQVKLRGYRVELGEIECRLVEQPGVRQAVASVREETPGDAQLVAYVVLDPGVDRDATVRDARAAIRNAVPAYMVPSHIIAIDEIPLGPTGKVDRRALPAVATTGGAEQSDTPAPPRTTIEHELMAIWEQLLPGRAIGIRDDFFDIGGHSLLAMQMLSEIERVRGRRLPFATLFTHTTIEALAGVIAGAVQDEGERRVLVLNPEGTRTPLIFLHGDVRGGGWYTRQLARALGADRPVVVLATVKHDNPARAATIEAMARYQLEAVRSVQPSGPYLIAGFCASGLIAFEMAQQLRREGDDVRMLALADTAALNAGFGAIAKMVRLATARRPESERLDVLARVLRSARYYRSRMRQVARVSRKEQLRWLVRLVLRNARAAVGSSEADGDVAQMLAGPPGGAGLTTLKYQQRAALAYIPRRYAAPLDLIIAVADRGAPVRGDRARGWARLARDVQVQTIESSHVGLITRHLDEFVAALARTLEQRDHA